MLKVCILSKEELSREVSRILTLVDLSEIEELDQLFLWDFDLWDLERLFFFLFQPSYSSCFTFDFGFDC